MSRTIALGFLIFAVLVNSSDVFAYCRTSTCTDHSGTLCVPASEIDCGIGVYWQNPCIGISIQENASSQISLDTATQILDLSMNSWLQAKCQDGQYPSLFSTNIGTVACNQVGLNQESGNANIIIFRDQDWPSDEAAGVIALTTVSYRVNTGEILGSDMEINTSQNQFSVTDTNITIDFQSILTHELGHFYGLAHTKTTDATMFADYYVGSSLMRDLEEDDELAICDAYPPNGVDLSLCDSTPYIEFQSECHSEAEEDSSGCSTQKYSTKQPSSWVILGLISILLAFMRARTKPKSLSKIS